MKKNPPKFKTKEAAFEITNDRNYCPKENMTKTNSEDCTYHKFAPFSHYINNIKINVHKSVCFKCLRIREIVKLTCIFAKSLIPALCFQ